MMIDHDEQGSIAVIAGNGRLPLYVADAMRRAGMSPFIVQLRNEGDHDWSGFPHIKVATGAFSTVVSVLKKHEIRRVVFCGGVTARPEFLSLRPTFRLLASLPSIWNNLRGGGDDKVLRMAIRLFEKHGFKIIGAQDIAGDLLVSTGRLGGVSPDSLAFTDIRAANKAARAIGALDIGQGAVSIGGRVIAVEGAEGTDKMLERVCWMRDVGRISRTRPGVLVKVCKPQQDIRADLPSIGPETVRAVINAGLSGIAVEAGRSLILDRQDSLAIANEAGLFIYGCEPSMVQSI